MADSQPSGLHDHLKDLESDAREADQDADEYDERMQIKIKELHEEINALVNRVKVQKDELKEILIRKKALAVGKWQEWREFKVSKLL